MAQVMLYPNGDGVTQDWAWTNQGGDTLAWQAVDDVEDTADYISESDKNDEEHFDIQPFTESYSVINYVQVQV
jgi:hypothetical protein